MSVKKAKKPRRSAEEQFEALPVAETVELVPAQVKAQPERYKQIGEERTFEVDITPPKLFKREIVRPKFKLIDDRDAPPVIEPALPRPAVCSYASAGLMAYVVWSKYLHHLPLYRQEKMSAHWGAQLSPTSRWPIGSVMWPTGLSQSMGACGNVCSREIIYRRTRLQSATWTRI